MVASIPPRKVVNADVGDADHVGGDDWDIFNDWMNDVDVTGPVLFNTIARYRDGKLTLRNPANTFTYTINTGAIGADRSLVLPAITGTDTLDTLGLAQTFTAAKTFNDNILKIRNPADTFSYSIRSAAIAANRDLNLPLITGTDTLATLGLAQTWTAANTFNDQTLKLRNPANTFSYTLVHSAIAADRNLTVPLLTANDTVAVLGLAQTFTDAQTIKKAGTPLVTLYRNQNTANNLCELLLDQDSSTSVERTYAKIASEIITNTNASEDGNLNMYVMKAGTLTKSLVVNKGGELDLGTSLRVRLRDTNTTAQRTFDFPDVSGSGGASTSSRLKSQTHQYTEFEDEFTCGSISATNTSNAIGVLCWGISAAGTAVPATLASATSHPGVIQLVTGATSGNDCRLHLGDTSTRTFANVSDIERIAFIIRIPTSTSITVRIGTGQDLSAASNGTSGIFFQFDPAVDSHWQTITRASSTSTTNTSTVTVTATNWYLLEIVQNSSNNWEFYINDTLAFTHSTNKPNGTTNAIGFVVVTNTTAARSLDIDWFKLRTIILGQRWT